MTIGNGSVGKAGRGHRHRGGGRRLGAVLVHGDHGLVHQLARHQIARIARDPRQVDSGGIENIGDADPAQVARPATAGCSPRTPGG